MTHHRFLSVPLALAALLLLPAMLGTARGENPPPLYAGTAAQNVALRAEMSIDSEPLAYYAKGDTVRFSAYEPSWLTVVKVNGSGTVTGYVPRHTVGDVVSLPGTPLPYGAEPAACTVSVARDTALRTSPKVTAETLFMLKKGQKIAVLSMENGWAKVIYWRQYAYFYLGDAKDVTPVYDALTAQPGDTVSAYVSFYSTATTELNPNRIVNIEQGCAYIDVSIAPGEKFSFESIAGPFTQTRGYLKAPSFFQGGTVPSNGGGVCQVSSTLYNVLLGVPDGASVLYRRPHGPSGAAYLPHGVDAAVGGENLDLVFLNTFMFPVRIEAHAQDGALYIALVREKEGI